MVETRTLVAIDEDGDEIASMPISIDPNAHLVDDEALIRLTKQDMVRAGYLTADQAAKATFRVDRKT